MSHLTFWAATIAVTGVLPIAVAATATAGTSPLPTAAPQPQPARILDASVTGEAAVRAVGDRLPQVAALNRKSPAELAALLRADHTLWLDQTGALMVKDDVIPRPVPSGATEAAPFPDDQTFRLHSRPGAPRVIYLDFDGHAISGTAWNVSYGVSSDPQPPFDLDGRPLTWSQAEHDLIQDVFLRVAEDYAPFDVDVTTQDPGVEALTRSSSADETFGARVLITPSDEAHDKVCTLAGGCGGFAYIGVFNRVDSGYYQPAWVFPHHLSNNAKYIAEAASHETGHNVGLSHDGTSSVTYYPGHRNWAPIMGVGYYEPLVQWSRGEYPGANNTEDDVTVVQGFGLPLRPDDHGSTPATARALGTATTASGVIETRTDQDVFSISRTCSGPLTVALAPAPVSPNLDAILRLQTSTGAVVAENDPVSGTLSYDVASGLSASISTTVAAGAYYLTVDGVGVLDTTSGYSDYGSLGQYGLTISPCSSAGTKVEETAPQIAYNGWRGMTDAVANGGTYRYDTATGSSAVFTFTGTSVTWLTRKGPGQGIATALIDGVSKGNVDLYAPAVGNFSTSYTGLAAKKHTLTVKVSGKKNAAGTGYSVVIDGFTVAGVTTQESAKAVKYGSWAGSTSVNASGGNYRTSGTANATVTFKFTGTSVDWITATGPGWGKAQVSIDGVDKGTVDLYRSTARWQTVLTYGGLTSGAHTLTLKVLGAKNTAAASTKVSIDAFTVRS